MSPRNEEEEKAYMKQLKSLKKKMRHSPDGDVGTPGKQMHVQEGSSNMIPSLKQAQKAYNSNSKRLIADSD